MTMPPSPLRSFFVLRWRAALFTVYSFTFVTLMLVNFRYLRRSGPDGLQIYFGDNNIVYPPRHGLVLFDGVHRTPTLQASDADFEKALGNLTDLIPDEVRIEQLLSPIDYSEGTSMLRDLALRTRSFKALFAAWENLHIVTSTTSSDVLVQSNIIERIRRSPLHDTSGSIQRYDAVRSFMNKFSQHLFPWTMGHTTDHMLLHASFAAGGQGIVVTANNRQVAYVLTSIQTFREFGCFLPVEVFFLGDADLHEGSRAALAKLPGVTTRDLSKMVYDNGWTLKGWAAKPMAMLLSSFREVVLLDADVLFLVDPATLLSDPDYVRFGALFFRDRLFAPADRADFITKSLPSPLSENILKTNRWWLGTSQHMQESGVVIVDKWRHYVALLLTTRLNGPERDGDELLHRKGVYQMMHGDKETFWLGWEMAGDSDYAFYDGRAGQIGVVASSDTENSDENETGMCGIQLLHTSREGRPLWFNGWIASNKHDDDHLIKFQEFQGFVTEPRETTKGDAHYWNGWEVREGNIMCLANDGYVPLSADEIKKINLILETAKEVIAPGI